MENVLYAEPLPEDGDLEGAIEICRQGNIRPAQEFLVRLKDNQDYIRSVSDALTAIPTRIFGDQEKRDQFRRLLIKKNLLKPLVVAQLDKEQTTRSLIKLADDLRHEYNFTTVPLSKREFERQQILKALESVFLLRIYTIVCGSTILQRLRRNDG